MNRTVWVVSSIALFVPAVATAGEPSQAEILACGQVVTRQLEAGASHTYVPIIPGAEDAVGFVDIVDVSGTIGELRLRERTSRGGVTESCSGTLGVDAGSTIEVSDCSGGEGGTYAITLNLVPDSDRCTIGACDCGVHLQCGDPPRQGDLGLPGAVDSFTFRSVAGSEVRVSVTDPGDPEREFRIRSFGAGLSEEDVCATSLALTPNDNTISTILISSCDGVSTGAYTIQLERTHECQSRIPANEVVYVLNAGSGSIDVVRPATGTVETTIPLLSSFEDYPRPRLYTSNDGAFAYAALPFSGRLPAVDTVTNRVAANAFFPGDSTSFALHPNGRLIYAVSAALGGVGLVDTASMSIVGSIPVPDVFDGAGIDVLPNATRLYVVTQTPSIAVVDVATATVVGTIVDSRIRADSQIRISPTGSVAYVFDPALSSSGGTPRSPLVVVDLAGGTVVKEFPLTPFDVAFSADGSRVYATANGGLQVIDTSDHTLLDFIDLGDLRVPQGIAISSSSNLVYVTDADAELDGGPPSGPGLAIVAPDPGEVLGLVFLAGSNPFAAVTLTPPPGLCAGDEVRESKVTIGELMTSVNFALDGCPGGAPEQ